MKTMSSANETTPSRRAYVWFHPFIDHVPYSPLYPVHHRFYPFKTRFCDFLTSDGQSWSTICEQISLKRRMLSQGYSRSTSGSLWCYCLHTPKESVIKFSLKHWYWQYYGRRGDWLLSNGLNGVSALISCTSSTRLSVN
jgi:hypothetical protein